MSDTTHGLYKNTHEFIWVACVSLTGQFFHELIISTTLKDDTQLRVPTCLEFRMNMNNALYF